MQNQPNTYSYNDVHDACHVLGISISLDDFARRKSTYIKLKKNYDTAISDYILLHSKDVLLLSQQYMKTENMPLPQAVGMARIYFKNQAISLIKEKRIPVKIPEKQESEVKALFPSDLSLIREKVANWKNHHNNHLLLCSPAKELMRRCNFSELDILLKDLNIPKKDYARFKTNIARYNGSLDDFLIDFEQRKLHYFNSDKNYLNINSSFCSPRPIEDLSPKKIAIREDKAVPTLSEVKSIHYRFPSFTLSQKSVFNWLKGIKKCYKVCSVHFNKSKNTAKQIPLQKAKTVFLHSNLYAKGKKTLKYAAILVPFFTMEFLGYKQACNANAANVNPKLSALANSSLNKKISEMKLQYDKIVEESHNTANENTEDRKKSIRDAIREDVRNFFNEEEKEKLNSVSNPLSENCILDMKPLGLASARISSPYGYRTHPIYGNYRLHTGVDYAAPAGTPIYASADGVVQRAERAGGYGRYVVIKHNSEYSTAYAHMSAFASGMRAGTEVKKGEIIGYVGSSGNSTGPHLHFEVIKNGKKVNPLNLGQVNILASR